MTRLLAGLVLGAAVLAILYAAAVRPHRHPLMIDAASSWCSYQQPGPLVTNPRPYDYQLGKRRIGDRA